MFPFKSQLDTGKIYINHIMEKAINVYVLSRHAILCDKMEGYLGYLLYEPNLTF